MHMPHRLKRISLLIASAVVAVGVSTAAASQAGFAAADQVSQASYTDFMDDWLYTHTGDDRGYGPEHDFARDNIAFLFESYGLTVTLEPFTYSSTTYYNVVATKPGTIYPNEEYVVGAHYDSVNNPGADDDASGVALLLEAARIISQYDSDFTIRFIAFDREEQGLIGSAAYVDDHSGDTILGMIQADMIAYDPSTNNALLYGRQPLKGTLGDAIEMYGDGLAYTDGGWNGQSDHASFDDVGIQNCLIIEGEVWSNPYYHTQQDSFEQVGNLNFPYAVKMTRSVVGWLVDHAGVIVEPGLRVTPWMDFNSAGPSGGPFTPASTVYTLENLGDTSFNYSVTKSAPWVSLTNTSGSLAPQETTEVTVSINADAESLPMGRHEDTVNFINTTDGIGNTARQVNLAVGIPDDCENAAPACPGTYSDSTADMTNDGSASCGTSDSTPDMWYSYLPDSSGSATFSLCTGTGYDAVLSVHSGCPGTAANQLGCDDDGCGTGGGPATVTISVTGGNTYLIRVTGWNGSTGSFTLNITGPDCAAGALSISFPGGLPEALAPGVATDFTVQIEDGAEVYVPGSGLLHYRYDGGTYLSSALASLGGDLYQATLPAADCGDTPEYYISADGDGGTTVTSPGNAPSSVYPAVVGTIITVMDDDFETDQGWTVSGDATDGQWERGIPVDGGRGDPPSDYDGSGRCTVTDNVAGDSDVDNGTTILTSPVMDMNGGGTISYAYWLNDISTGPLGPEDSMEVEIATNPGGTNWQLMRTYDTASASWRLDSIEVGTEVATSPTLRIRFKVSDLSPGDVVEGGLDAFKAISVECISIATGACCFTDGSCTVGTEEACTTAGGTYEGNDTDCDPNPCPQPCDLPGDMNGDTFINGADVQGFTDAMVGAYDPCADLAEPFGILDMADVTAFVGELLQP